MNDFVGNPVALGDQVVIPSPYFPTRWVTGVVSSVDRGAGAATYINAKGERVIVSLVSGSQFLKVIK